MREEYAKKRVKLSTVLKRLRKGLTTVRHFLVNLLTDQSTAQGQLSYNIFTRPPTAVKRFTRIFNVTGRPAGAKTRYRKFPIRYNLLLLNKVLTILKCVV